MDWMQIKTQMRWNECYVPGWDAAPENYRRAGIVKDGRSRRLGVLRMGTFKCYVGLQHVDPKQPGWGMVPEAHTRFFASMFVAGRCVALRTFPTMQGALEALSDFVEALGEPGGTADRT